MGDWLLQTHLLWWIPKSIFQCCFASVSSFSGLVHVNRDNGYSLTRSSYIHESTLMSTRLLSTTP